MLPHVVGTRHTQVMLDSLNLIQTRCQRQIDLSHRHMDAQRTRLQNSGFVKRSGSSCSVSCSCSAFPRHLLLLCRGCTASPHVRHLRHDGELFVRSDAVHVWKSDRDVGTARLPAQTPVGSVPIVPGNDLSKQIHA